jgi:hypothetical protein
LLAPAFIPALTQTIFLVANGSNLMGKHQNSHRSFKQEFKLTLNIECKWITFWKNFHPSWLKGSFGHIFMTKMKACEKKFIEGFEYYVGSYNKIKRFKRAISFFTWRAFPYRPTSSKRIECLLLLTYFCSNKL